MSEPITTTASAAYAEPPPPDGGTSGQLQTTRLGQAAITRMREDLEPTAEEIAQALVILREKRLAEAEERERLAPTITEGFTHYFLANARYPYEKILMPNGLYFWAFYRGRILIDSPEKERVVLAACGDRVHREDLSEPKQCRICGTWWYSLAAHAECQLGH